ncbi:45472_t:CDS:2, partial [Gigaspora margarita]
METMSNFAKENLPTIIGGTLVIAKHIPITSAIASLVDEIQGAINKAKHGQAICKFIARNIEETQKILEQCENIQLNDDVLEQYKGVLKKIKDYVNSIQQNNFWKKIKLISTAAEFESKCMLLIEELNAIGDHFKLTLQLDTKKDTIEIKKSLIQFGKDLRLMAINHGLSSTSIKIKPSDIHD